ncbi:hypothetical protein ACIBI9_58025 [Nonomuraea sp. NPDC050451]|uniref:hypothetical protein n=1 Tax=Nonomuraea sp. NPDC050451 TaxID=3364364 RepID=UPI00379272E0
MDALKAMWETVPPATPDDLAGARRRLIDGMHTRRRVVTVPRALVAVAATAAVALTPQVIGTGTSAYAVTKDPDGTLTVTLKELRDPDGLEAELAGAGVKADVTFLAPGMRCEVPRFVGADESYGGPPVDGADELRERVGKLRSFKAIRGSSGKFQIFPEYIRPGETLVLEFSDERSAQVLWRMGSWLAKAGSPVKPCTPVPHTG